MCYIEIVLLSGGLDSTYALVKNLKSTNVDTIYCVFFKYGQKNVEQEEKAFNSICNKLSNSTCGKTNKTKPTIATKIIETGNVFSWSLAEPMTNSSDARNLFGPCEIENRNLVFLSILASYAYSLLANSSGRADVRIITGLRENEMPDSKKKFFDSFFELCNQYKPEIHFDIDLLDDDETPTAIYQNLKKICGDADAIDIFAHTHSCYNAGTKCGTCTKCTQLLAVTEKISKETCSRQVRTRTI